MENKILIAVTTRDSISERTAAWLMRMAQRKDVVTAIVKGRPEDFARNQACHLMLGHFGFTHLLFLDSDIEPPMDALDRLLSLDEPIATGIYAIPMTEELHWAISKLDEDGHYRTQGHLASKSPHRVDGCGAGCLLIRRDVIEQLGWPWFKWEEFEDGSQTGEDIYFCKKAAAGGILITCDPSVICRHFKTVNITSLLEQTL